MSVFRLDNKVAVVTGAAGSIGTAVANLFSMQGARLLLADVEFDKVQALAAALPGEAFPCRADFGKVSQCRAVIEKAVEHYAQLDILVNNVGICPRISFLDSTEEDWERIVAVNQRSMFFCSQAAAPHLRKSKGRIVSLASYGGRAGGAANASIYSGTKGAIISLTKSMARELAPDVLVNAVAPGVIDTALVRNLPPEKIAALVETIPLKRLGTAEEVAYAVLFLAANDCGYLTGATIDINGGWMMI
jgi:meso-butanediol dehydrogenase / (S,S)-butanediol dehydrogenase / diacetyl reductase